jgi:single-strand DNA-binding protein
MAGLPEITLAGTLVADPELRYTPTGAAVANFTVAANDRRYDPTTGEWADKGATFLRCSLWRQAAEHLAESLTKGTRVLLTGVLRQRDWETLSGEQRTTFEVEVSEIAASLKWATVKVTKPTRDTPTPVTSSPADTAAGTGPSEPGDPWGEDKPPL